MKQHINTVKPLNGSALRYVLGLRFSNARGLANKI